MGAIRAFFRGAGKVVKWTLILGALLIVVVVIVAIVSVGEGVEESEESAEQVTPAKYRQISNGQTESEVRAILGKPEDTDTTSVEGLGRSDCWYYGILADQTTQICFDNGQVNYKAQYGSK